MPILPITWVIMRTKMCFDQQLTVLVWWLQLHSIASVCYGRPLNVLASSAQQINVIWILNCTWPCPDHRSAIGESQTWKKTRIKTIFFTGLATPGAVLTWIDDTTQLPPLGQVAFPHWHEHCIPLFLHLWRLPFSSVPPNFAVYHELYKKSQKLIQLFSSNTFPIFGFTTEPLLSHGVSRSPVVSRATPWSRCWSVAPFWERPWDACCPKRPFFLKPTVHFCFLFYLLRCCWDYFGWDLFVVFWLLRFLVLFTGWYNLFICFLGLVKSYCLCGEKSYFLFISFWDVFCFSCFGNMLVDHISGEDVVLSQLDWSYIPYLFFLVGFIFQLLWNRRLGEARWPEHTYSSLWILYMDVDHHYHDISWFTDPKLDFWNCCNFVSFASVVCFYQPLGTKTKKV